MYPASRNHRTPALKICFLCPRQSVFDPWSDFQQSSSFSGVPVSKTRKSRTHEALSKHQTMSRDPYLAWAQRGVPKIADLLGDVVFFLCWTVVSWFAKFVCYQACWWCSNKVLMSPLFELFWGPAFHLSSSSVISYWSKLSSSAFDSKFMFFWNVQTLLVYSLPHATASGLL